MSITNSNSNTKFVKVVYIDGNKDNGTPRFGVQKKVGSNWEIGETGDTIKGILVGIEKDSYEYIGKPQHQYKLKLNSDGVIYSLELGYSYYSRGVLNNLSGAGDISNKVVELFIYRNKGGFVSIFVKVDGEKTEWDLPVKDLPKSNSKKWLDSFAYFIDKIVVTEDFIEKELEKLEELPEKSVADVKEEAINSGVEEEESDLPF